jgi:hypothetical protein
MLTIISTFCTSSPQNFQTYNTFRQAQNEKLMAPSGADIRFNSVYVRDGLETIFVLQRGTLISASPRPPSVTFPPLHLCVPEDQAFIDFKDPLGNRRLCALNNRLSLCLGLATLDSESKQFNLCCAQCTLCSCSQYATLTGLQLTLLQYCSR